MNTWKKIIHEIVDKLKKEFKIAKDNLPENNAACPDDCPHVYIDDMEEAGTKLVFK